MGALFLDLALTCGASTSRSSSARRRRGARGCCLLLTRARRVGAAAAARRAAVARAQRPCLRRVDGRRAPRGHPPAGCGERRAGVLLWIIRGSASIYGRAAVAEQRDPRSVVPVLRAFRGRGAYPRRDRRRGRDVRRRRSLVGGALAALWQPTGREAPPRSTPTRADLSGDRGRADRSPARQSLHVDRVARRGGLADRERALRRRLLGRRRSARHRRPSRAARDSSRAPVFRIPSRGVAAVGGFTLRWVMVRAGQLSHIGAGRGNCFPTSEGVDDDTHYIAGIRTHCPGAGPGARGARARGEARDPAGLPELPQGAANALQGVFENVAFKSQSIQLKIDAHTKSCASTRRGRRRRRGEALARLRDIAKTARRVSSTTSRRTARSSPQRSRSRARSRSRPKSCRTTPRSSGWSR